MDELFCLKCGAQLDASDSVCRHCGAATPSAQTITTGEVAIPVGLDPQLETLTAELRTALAPGLLLLRQLGQGGMGTVFLARDPALKRNVVVKVLSPELAHNEQARRRFEREAEAAAAVSHPNVVSVFQVGTLPRLGTSYFVMRHVEGEPLEVACPLGTLTPEARAKRIIGEIASALAAAHARGLVHRDIKPANIMLEADTDRVIVLDFGISAAVGSLRRAPTDTKLTEQGTSIGTPQYMSPEQAAGEEVTDRSDVYSLGLVAFELLAGLAPFAEATPMALAAAHIHKLPPSVAKLRPDADPNLAQLVDQCLLKDPAQRPSARSMAAALLPQGATRVEWPPPGLDPIRGTASRYLRGTTRFAIGVMVYAVLSTGAVQEAGGSALLGAIIMVGAVAAVWYAFAIGTAARHLPRAVADARRAGYPRRVVLDVAIDQRLDTEHLINRVGPFARLSAHDVDQFLRQRRIGFVAASTAVVFALFGPAVAMIARESDVAVFMPSALLVLAALARWGIERPERQFRRRFLRDEGGRRQVKVGSDLVEAWLTAGGQGGLARAQHPWADRLAAGVFNGVIAATLFLGWVWFFNVMALVIELDKDPPGKSESHFQELQNARDAARRPFPSLALDSVVTAEVTPWPTDQLGVLLRDSTRRTVARLAGVVDGAPSRDGRAASEVETRARLGLAASYAPLGAWRSLSSATLPLLWYRPALSSLQNERTRGTADTGSVALAAACQCNRPLREIGRFATLQAASAMLAAARGDEGEALRRAAEMVGVGRNLGRDPLTVAAGSAVLSRAAELLGALAPITGRPWLTRDSAALATYRASFDQAAGAFAGKPAVKAAVRPLVAESLLVLAGDTSLQPVYRRGLARAAVLGACYTGEDLFFNVDRERERLVDSVLARVAGIPDAVAYAEFVRDLDWRRRSQGWRRNSSFWVRALIPLIFVVPRTSHCQNLGLLGDTTSTRM